MPTLRDAIKFVSTCSDLDELKAVIDMAVSRRAALGKLNVAAFRPGDKVKFKNRDGIYLHGVFSRRLTKNVEVKVNNGTSVPSIWRVSPQFIERDDT